ncbi:hypothetical protein [Sphingopyxis macrogoltabida]|uniref:Lipoprotein n=1 Tax=Sphingopyxis macrogoltabida TaxID=33050 RepID=A0AAC8YYZ7_SPHMC|nr:hypothetical protein [Sphingopyxis macrogoltabida]ALJ13776.1 hypothetical protein LH19_12940 [Sphingopyxis macrogoltabida]AMU88784.1 hypothetical protein ATM17_06970 [Sphingopyxis macrogoltabida]
MRAAASALLGIALLSVAGCGGESDPAETGQGGWHIPGGTYGNVAAGQGGTDLRGFELTLDQGSESETVDFVECDDRCVDVESRSLRRGLNGISFTVYRKGRMLDVLVNPAGKDAVELSLDQGEGLESHRLPRIDREVALAIARGKADSAAAPSADALLEPKSPPPLPSPTP